MSLKLAGHRIHPILVAFPIGLLGASVVFDVVWLATRTERWADVAFCMLGSGVVSGFIAAPFGSLDWLGISSGTRAKRIGFLHGLTAFTAVALFSVSWWFRYEQPTAPGTVAISLSFVGLGVLSVAGWLGGELVERMGIGVDTGAHPDSPSSLSGRSAAESVAGESDNASSHERSIVDAARSVS